MDKNGNPIWKDGSDKMTDFMRSKQQALRNSASKHSTGAGAKAIEAVKRLNELEQQGWAPEELSRVLASTYGVPSDDITIDDLGLGASSGFQRANAIKQYIKRNPDHFTDPERANALIEALDRVGDSGRLSADLANAEKWFMNDLKPEIANQIRDYRNAKYQPSNNLEQTIA
jgi:hypothetical protein